MAGARRWIGFEALELEVVQRGVWGEISGFQNFGILYGVINMYNSASRTFGWARS
jgi:hypothetical protein